MLLAALAVLTATPATVEAQLAAAKPGDTVRLSGEVYGRIVVRDLKKAAPRVTIDAKAATIGVVAWTDASGFTLVGGVFRHSGNYAQIVQNSENIDLVDGIYVDATNSGMTIQGSRHISVMGNAFRNPSDGVDVINSAFVDIERNNCLVAQPAGGHADCVQLWNTKGAPVDSDITIAWNAAVGYEQGFSMMGGTGAARANIHDNSYAGVMGYAGGWLNCTPGCTMKDNVAMTLNVTAPGTHPAWIMTGPGSAAERNLNGPKN
ncbi:MAG TPA: hypothetical protein VHY32_03725 [Caulobacteraceae bacterium]|jgi:hypothetical protein|nr:hypothetical protein [Caulobacteraceae bacterium]